MDKKISQFVSVTSLLANDILPVVSGGVNKSVTVGLLALNLPNIGNKGITKNSIITSTSLAIPLTGTVVKLTTNAIPHTLGVGSEGQTITVLSTGVNTLNFGTVSAALVAGSSITLVFSTVWFVISSYQTTVTQL